MSSSSTALSRIVLKFTNTFPSLFQKLLKRTLLRKLPPSSKTKSIGWGIPTVVLRFSTSSENLSWIRGKRTATGSVGLYFSPSTNFIMTFWPSTPDTFWGSEISNRRCSICCRNNVSHVATSFSFAIISVCGAFLLFMIARVTRAWLYRTAISAIPARWDNLFDEWFSPAGFLPERLRVTNAGSHDLLSSTLQAIPDKLSTQASLGSRFCSKSRIICILAGSNCFW